MKTPTLTACIITKNSQEIIADCVESIKWADEILVVDTGSRDMTVDLVKGLGARVVTHTKGSYDAWRNAGLKAAKGEWIFYIDSDERASKEVGREIKSVIADPKHEAYAIPRTNIVLGKALKYGGFGDNDYQKRVFRRESLKKWVGTVHEQPQYVHEGKLTTGNDGEIGHLTKKLLHIKAQTITEMIDKSNVWSEKEAKLMYDAHHPPMNVVRFTSAMVREFVDRFIKKRAFLDGPVGIIHGLYQVFSRFMSYAKLYEMQLNKK